MMTDLLLPSTSYAFCFYFGACVTCLSFLILWRFEEKLDVENLKKFNGVVLVETEEEQEPYKAV